MTAANYRAYDTDLLDSLAERVIVGDGAMGTQLQEADLTLDDFNNLKGCNEILDETRPDITELIHQNCSKRAPTPSRRVDRGDEMGVQTLIK